MKPNITFHFVIAVIIYVANFLTFPTLALAGKPSSFSSVKEFFEKIGGYSESNGTLKILSLSPLHIQLSPVVVKEDFPETIENEVRRALVDGIYRSFIHTNVNQIVVTAVPLEIDFSTKERRYVIGYKRTISKSRKEALDLVKRYLRVSSFSDLITDFKVGDMVFSDQWTKEFKRLYYNDQGPPGLVRFVGELAK